MAWKTYTDSKGNIIEWNDKPVFTISNLKDVQVMVENVKAR